MSRLSCVVLFLSAVLLVSACGDDFAESWLLEEPRVVGAELSVVGAPERPIPALGESVDVRWVIAAADANEDFTWVAGACEAQPSPVGRPICAAEPFFVAGTETPTTEEPGFQIAVPTDLDPDNEVLMLGVLCPEGVPNAQLANSRDLNINTVCTEGQGQIVLQSIRTNVDSANVSPVWPEPSIFVDGAEWRDGECLEVSAASTVEITLGEFPDSMRETYTRTTNDIPPREVELREVLLVSHLITHGELSRQFSAIDGESEIRPIEWEAPDIPPSEPVRVVLGLRDQRSGAHFIERALCVVP